MDPQVEHTPRLKPRVESQSPLRARASPKPPEPTGPSSNQTKKELEDPFIATVTYRAGGAGWRNNRCQTNVHFLQRVTLQNAGNSQLR